VGIDLDTTDFQLILQKDGNSKKMGFVV